MYTFDDINPTPMEDQEGDAGLTQLAAVASCIAMAVFYVAILYVPTLILRLPPPISFKSFLIRRFVCAAISSIVSLVVCSLILPDPIRTWDASNVFGVYGIRLDHIWQALVFPLSLTSLMYTGSFVRKILSMLRASSEDLNSGGNLSFVCIKSAFLKFIDWIVSTTSNVSCWRNYFVAPLTEELVFRACMIPLLLCGGFSTYTVIFLCPIFFSLDRQIGITSRLKIGRWMKKMIKGKDGIHDGISFKSWHKKMLTCGDNPRAEMEPVQETKATDISG